MTLVQCGLNLSTITRVGEVLYKYKTPDRETWLIRADTEECTQWHKTQQQSNIFPAHKHHNERGGNYGDAGFYCLVAVAVTSHNMVLHISGVVKMEEKSVPYS